MSIRGSHFNHQQKASIGQKAQLSNAYQELGKELTSPNLKSIGNYTLGRVIGEGTYGTVRLGLHRLTSQRVAIKQIPKSLSSFSSSSSFSHNTSSTPLDLLTREIHHHRRFHHPNVVQLYELLASESSIYFVFELCPMGELFDYLISRGRLTQWESRRIFGEICLGVGYVHGMGVCHRDLKLENILMGEGGEVKVADFGFGREMEEVGGQGGGRGMETWCGTSGYAAPEMGEKYNGEDEAVVRRKAKAGSYDDPSWLGSEPCDLVSNILQVNPNKRFTIRQILEHKWFEMDLPDFHEYQIGFDSEAGEESFLEEGEDTMMTMTTGGGKMGKEEDTTVHEESERGSQDSKNQPNVQPETYEYATSNSSAVTLESSSSSSSNYTNPLEHSITFSSSGSSVESGKSTPVTSDEDVGSPGLVVEEKMQGKGEFERGRNKGIISSASSSSSLSSSNTANPLNATVSSSSSSKDFQIFHRNESQSTIKISPSPRLSSGGTSSTGRGLKSLPTHVEDGVVCDDEEFEEAEKEDDRKGLGLGMSRPSLVGLNAIGGSGFSSRSGSGNIMTMHARTPSRTKRRSVGSLIESPVAPPPQIPPLSNPIESSNPLETTSRFLPPSVSYLALYLLPQASQSQTCFGEKWEKNLLDSLKLVGFDTGQMVHSVRNDACDASGAIWWMLRRKREKEMKEKEEGKEHSRVNVGTQTDGSGSSSLSVSFYEETQMERGSTKGNGLHPGQLFLDSRSYSETQSISASNQLPLPTSPTTPIPTLNENFPTTSLSSSSSSFKAPSTKTKPRSASVSILQRATSAFTGGGLSHKKSQDFKKDKEKENEGESGGRMTPVLAGLFGRKMSINGGAAAGVSVMNHSSLSSTSLANPSSIHTPRSPRTPKTPNSSSSVKDIGIEERRGSDNNNSSASLSAGGNSGESKLKQSESLLSVASSVKSSVLSSGKGEKGKVENQFVTSPSGGAKRGKKNIFSSFRTWFHEDRRKRSSKGRNHPPLAVNTSHYSRDSFSKRSAPRGSVNSRRSTLRATVDISSSAATPIQGNRRLSVSSRGSIGSRARTPTSDRARSRPPSSQRRQQHGRHGSSSSTGSFHFGPGGASPAPSFRRPPTSTTVRRVSNSTYTQKKHGRNQSTSSVGTSSSRRSSLRDKRDSFDSDDGVSLGGEEIDPIQEESESLAESFVENQDDIASLESVEGQREQALRKLSGESIRDLATNPPNIHEVTSRLRSENRNHNNKSIKSNSNPSTFFVAQRNKHLFGPPSNNGLYSSLSLRANQSSLRPNLRDVFGGSSSGNDDSDWVDEDDEFAGYSGGLGQGGSSIRSSTPSSSVGSDAGNQQHTSSQISTAPMDNHSSNGPMLGEGRYAGIGAMRGDSFDGSWKSGVTGGGRKQQPVFRGPTITEEEEEEE